MGEWNALCREFQSWKQGLHRIPVKLQEVLVSGLITESHIFMRILEQGLDLALASRVKPGKPFVWEPVVLSFWESLLFYCGKAGIRMLNGPGLHGKVNSGRTVDRTQFSFNLRNLPGPSLRTVQKQLPGYTVTPGVIRDLLVSMCMILAVHKDIAIVSNDTVAVFPVSLASDGFSVKPGLQVDQRAGTVIGLMSGPQDLRSIRSSPILEPARFKRDVITDIVQLELLSMTMDVSLPVGALFKPKSKTGQAWMTEFTDIVDRVATCLRCARLAGNVRDHVFVGDPECVTTPCNDCKGHSVCSACTALGHRHVEVGFRACDSCIQEKQLCQRMTCLLLPADCESYQNTGMELWLKRYRSSSTEEQLHSLALPCPEDVHLVKRLRAALKNYWISVDGQRINLSILWFMRNQGSLETRRKWERALPGSAVLGRDNMDVDSVLHQSAPAVRQLLNDPENSAIVVEIVPDRFRYWTGNRPGVVGSPTSICMADFGYIAFTDCDRGVLFLADNHSPTNVSALARNLDRPDCVTYARGLIVFAETGKRKGLKCADLSGDHVLSPDSMKIAQLKTACSSRGLATTGRKADLSARLADWLADPENFGDPDGSPMVVADRMESDKKLPDADREAADETEREPWAKKRHKSRPSLPLHTISLTGVPDSTVVRALLLSQSGRQLIISSFGIDSARSTILDVELKFDGRSATGVVKRIIDLNQGQIQLSLHPLFVVARFRGAWFGMARLGSSVLRYCPDRRHF